jgi:hypothetical protein
MRFAPSREQRDFATTIRELLADSDTIGAARAWAAGDTDPGKLLVGKLSDAGVTGLAVDEDGAEPIDVALAFVELGRAAMPGPVIESFVVAPLFAASVPTLRGRLDGLLAGDELASIGVQDLVPDLLDADVTALRLWLADGRLSTVDVSGDPIRSVDPARRLFAATERNTVAETVSAVPIEHGFLAASGYLLGAGEEILRMSVDYVAGRHQFGRPVGSFQAVKHALADVHVALELARPLLYGAALALAGEGRVERDVSAAKLACARAAYLAARTGLQVHGALGYTAEYDLSVLLLKVRALQHVWGTSAYHRGRVLRAITNERVA